MGDKNLPRMGNNSSSLLADDDVPAAETDAQTKYKQDLQAGLRELREEDELCDVTLIAEGKHFPCHRVVLAAASGYFRGMFCGHLAETRSREVEMKELDSETLQLLLDFVYSSSVPITQDNVEALGKAADMYQVAGLRDLCDAFMVTQLDLSNCIGMYRFARLHNMDQLIRAARDMALQNFVRVIGQEEYLQLDKESVTELISSDELNVESEDAVFRALEVWMAADSEARYCQIDQFLPHLRLHYCTPKYLVGVVSKSPIMQGLEAQREIQLAVGQHVSGSLTDHPCPRRAFPWAEVLVLVGGHRTERQKSISVHIDGRWRKLLPHSGSTTPGGTYVSGTSLDILDGAMSCKVGSDILLFENKNGHLKPMLFDTRKPKRVTSFSSIPSRKTYFVVCECMERVYILGGLAREGSIVSFPTVECFILKQNQWKSLQSLPDAIFPMAAATHNENIFVFGGKVLPASRSAGQIKNVRSVFMYDTLADSWTQVGEVPSPGRVGLLAVASGKYIYVVVETNTRDCKFMRFEPGPRTWTTLTPPARQHTRGSALAMRGAQILLAGGTEAAPAEVYDVESDVWRTLDHMNIEDHQFGLHRIVLPKDVISSISPAPGASSSVSGGIR